MWNYVCVRAGIYTLRLCFVIVNQLNLFASLAYKCEWWSNSWSHHMHCRPINYKRAHKRNTCIHVYINIKLTNKVPSMDHAWLIAEYLAPCRVGKEEWALPTDTYSLGWGLSVPHACEISVTAPGLRSFDSVDDWAGWSPKGPYCNVHLVTTLACII